jgi:hypothetical protein
VEPGYRILDGCFDNPADRRLRFPRVGFAISHDEKFVTYHRMDGDELIEQMGSGC